MEGERGRLARRTGAQPRAPAATATFNYGGTATDQRGNEGNGSGAHEGRRRTRPAWRRSSGEVDRARGSGACRRGRRIDPAQCFPARTGRSSRRRRPWYNSWTTFQAPGKSVAATTTMSTTSSSRANFRIEREREVESFGARVFVYWVGVTLSSSWRYWMLDTAAREAWMAARSPCSHCSER